MLLFFIISLIAVLLLFIYICMSNKNRFKGLPPGPTPCPIIGNIIPRENMDIVMLNLSKEYGDVFTLWLPEPIVVITGTKLLKETIGVPSDVFGQRPVQFLMTQIYQGTYGLFFNDNNFYKSQRKFARKTLHELGVSKPEITELIIDMANKMCDDLRETTGKVIELRPFVMRAVGNIIHKLMFGTITDDDDQEIAWFQERNVQVFEAFMEPKMLMLDSFPFLAKFDKLFKFGLEKNLKANKEITEFLYKKIELNKRNFSNDEEPSNYVDKFLKEMKKRGETELSDEYNEHQLAMSLFDLYSAAMETIVITIRASVLYLLNYPRVKANLFIEVDAILGHGSIPVYAERNKLPYVQAFLLEVYRLMYVLELGIFRLTSEAVHVGGYKIPANTCVMPQFVAAHMDPELFPEPEKLKPERHLKDGVFVNNEHINPFALGQRNCLGENLARREVFLFVVMLIQQFDFFPADATPPPVNIVTRAFRSPAPFELRVVPR